MRLHPSRIIIGYSIYPLGIEALFCKKQRIRYFGHWHQSTLRPPEVHIRTIHFYVNAQFAWRLWGLMICMPYTWGQK